MLQKLVPDIVHDQSLVTLGADATVRQAARMMRQRHVGSVLVMEGDALLGIFTERDMVYRVVAEGRNPDGTALLEVMTPDPDTIEADSLAIDALRQMRDGGYRHLPVMRDGRVIGIVSRRDICGEDKARLDLETVLWEKVR